MDVDVAGKVHVIACGVLAVDLHAAAKRLGLAVEMHFLPGGLHATPDRLRDRLQETIDAVSALDGVARIVIGYGICGRGSVGLRARNVPLVVPRVHDCIALFLGSDARYREQAARHPGTYYIAAGWVEDKGEEGLGCKLGSDGDAVFDDEAFRQLLRDYGEDDARHIRHFMDSWTRNYTRAAFIDSGVGEAKQRYERIARRMAENYGWHYERLQGSHDLLEKTLTATVTDDEVLVVPPGAVTDFDAIRRKMTALCVQPPGAGGSESGKSPAPDTATQARDRRKGLGLGIDAGGTYTDAVLFDFDTHRVLAKTKAPTTPWDYTVGIREALAGLDATLLERAGLVAVSTTLATNAIVEGRGQTTGLLVMPPYGWRDVTGFKHSPMALIDGQVEIDGTVRVPVNREQVRQIARRMVAEQGVTAFAVGGFASHANPAHEQEVREIVRSETGLGVTCAYELSEELNYRVRAETAALNARIIPCLRSLLERLQAELASRRIEAPVMVVRSDGSMMSLAMALERPLETMLSGPAASVAGATWLAGLTDALVVDVGGTTTDTAVVRDGRVSLRAEGATIGGWQTHIPALDLGTLGLGGDSHVKADGGTLRFGPERVAPLAWLAATQPGTARALAWIDAHINPRDGKDEEVVLYALVGRPDGLTPSPGERDLLALLAERPYSAAEAATVLGKVHFSLLPWRRLVERSVVQRCALTPTDALHAAGTVRLWNTDAALSACTWHAKRAAQDLEGFVRTLTAAFERSLATELLKKQVAAEVDADGIESQPVARQFLHRALSGASDGYGVRIELSHPVVGVGAPAGCFVPGAARLLHTRAVIPEHADVANAIGAITGTVSLRRRVTISVNEHGIFRLGGVPDAPAFARIEEATAYGEAYLRELLGGLVRKAGAATHRVRIESRDSSARATAGDTVFIGRTLEGWACGEPGEGDDRPMATDVHP